MNTLGFSWVYPMAMAAIIFGGSLEFVTISMLLSSFASIETFVVAFTVQARHLFYGTLIREIRPHRLEEALPYLYAV